MCSTHNMIQQFMSFRCSNGGSYDGCIFCVGGITGLGYGVIFITRSPPTELEITYPLNVI